MIADSTNKIERVLGIYTKLMNGAVVNKQDEANRYEVNERTIQRDLDDIRNYIDQQVVENGVINSVVYDRTLKGYRLAEIYRLKLSNSEILAICKILLDSRAFTKYEMENIIEKIIDSCVPKVNQKVVKDLIRNEAYHYIEPRHKSVFIDKVWTIGQAILHNNFIEIKYCGVKGSKVKTRKLKPLAIMFSEYYFYLTAFIDDKEVQENFSVLNDSFPTIYRIDRIQGLRVIDEKFNIPYANRFEEGEFRKRIQFMYGGKLQKIRFEYTGFSVDAVLDRLPTAVIEQENEGKYIISAEVFGDGIDMWIRSQGNYVKRLDE